MIEEARTLITSSTHGTLSTLEAGSGHPYGSLVALVASPQGEVAMLLSTLAEHTTNLTADPTSSILLRAQPAPEQTPLQAARVSILGTTARLDDPGPWRERFLTAHPDAAAYVGFSDFSFYLLTPTRLRFIAGFGRMGWIGAEEF